MFLSKQPYPFLNLIEIHKPWFSNPDAEIAAMFLGRNIKNWTCHFSFFLRFFVLLYVAHSYLTADKLCISFFFLSLKYIFCNQPLEGNIRQLTSWISGARATRFLILFGLQRAFRCDTLI